MSVGRQRQGRSAGSSCSTARWGSGGRHSPRRSWRASSSAPCSMAIPWLRPTQRQMTSLIIWTPPSLFWLRTIDASAIDTSWSTTSGPRRSTSMTFVDESRIMTPSSVASSGRCAGTRGVVWGCRPSLGLGLLRVDVTGGPRRDHAEASGAATRLRAPGHRHGAAHNERRGQHARTRRPVMRLARQALPRTQSDAVERLHHADAPTRGAEPSDRDTSTHPPPRV